ncbi:heme peroxidase [Flagelloscypha sp. PMI_526]|nr:heme peroxidase [Flagelloscypha sp. PMI_526]
MSSFSLLRSAARRTATRASLRSAGPARQAARKYSTEAKSGGGNGVLFGGLAVAIAAGGAFYFYNSSVSPLSATPFKPTPADYQKVYNRIADLLDEAGDAGYDDGSYGPVILRLAWHASGTYDKDSKTGGSNYATMRFAPESLHGANAGLDVARGLMDKIKAEFPWISYGDLWTLGGVAAIQEMGGPVIPWRPGRIDGFDKDATPDGRLPDASQGSDHLRNIFYRMGFNDQEIVALSGAHALGRCHKTRSGYEGPWTFSPITLTNDFFTLLFKEKWTWKKWEGPKQLEDKGSKTLMMLPTDFALTQDRSFKKYAQAYANDQDLFFKDFSAVIARLFELGVPVEQLPAEPWTLKTLDEQKEAKN